MNEKLEETQHVPSASQALLLATRNRAKAERLRSLCYGLGFDVRDGASLPEEPDVEEDAASHLGNAIRKAVAWSRAYGGLVIASDGGLAIPALGRDWSSLITRRGTGANVSDEERAARLLRRMRHLEGEQRSVYWVEALAVARDGTFIEGWEASGLHGRIADDYLPPEGGTRGFWVSGLWLTAGGKRHWELSDRELAEAGDPWEKLTPPARGLLALLRDASQL